MESVDLSVVIVTFKSEDKIFSCIKSIPRNVSIIVVENSNNINFKNMIENNHSNAKCILLGENRGYSVANNIGLKEVSTKFALVLNPDTTLNKDTIKNFLILAAKINDFWLIGPSNNQDKEYSFVDKNFLEVDNLKGFGIFFNLMKFNNDYFDEEFFLFFEEIDLCKRIRNKRGKIFLCKDIIINHEGAGSVSQKNKHELEINRNWHWMWSTFYYHKKYKGFLIAIMIILPKLLSSILKIVYYQMFFNHQKRDIYLARISGIMNSILGKKSWYRPSLD